MVPPEIVDPGWLPCNLTIFFKLVLHDTTGFRLQSSEIEARPGLAAKFLVGSVVGRVHFDMRGTTANRGIDSDFQPLAN